jgi:hypothetical protein
MKNETQNYANLQQIEKRLHILALPILVSIQEIITIF